MLQLHRPLVFVSAHATGLDPEKDHIVELALIKVHPAEQVWSNDSTQTKTVCSTDVGYCLHMKTVNSIGECHCSLSPAAYTKCYCST